MKTDSRASQAMIWAKAIRASYLDKNWSLNTLKTICRRVDEMGSAGTSRAGSGRLICHIISLQSYVYYWYSITHSLFHSRLKSFLFCESSLPQPFLCLLQDSLYGFPRLFTATSEHIRLFTF